KAAKRVIRMEISDGPFSHEFSSTQFDLPATMCGEFFAMAARINADDLEDDGIETNPHITIKYGLHTNDPRQVADAIAGQPPVAVTFGKTSVFANDKCDVVKVEIESNGLRELNAC